MRRARAAILRHGGAANSNVFTRTLLALYGEMPWRGVPSMPVEIMHLPRWFPFHLTKSPIGRAPCSCRCWSLNALKPKARNPERVGIDGAVRQPAGTRAALARAPHQTFPGRDFRGDRASCAASSHIFPSDRANAPSKGRRLCDGAAEWRGRARRDFSGHGQFGP